MILSEYGITDVNKPIDLNKVFRIHNWLAIKDELGREMLDCGASKVFAVADHQIAHIYINDPSLHKRVRNVVAEFLGPEQVLDSAGKAAAGIAHPRAGDVIAIAPERCWFTYYYWGDPAVAPDFARCVDIHRKPGYDPVELFIDPALKFPKAKIGWRLLKKKLGFRMLMDVIPLDPSLVRGSHGIRPTDPNHHPILITQASDLGAERIEATDVFHILRRHVRG
jgi:predicted AlkP superfamily pyrophosphatase or phosphodiesterase